MPSRIALLLLVVTLGAIGPAFASESRWEWPLPGTQVGRSFDPPDTRYGPGHRGIDVVGAVGQRVTAVAAGTVRFAGEVAGIGVVVVDHGVEQSTYQPLRPSVRVGEAVSAGDVIGRLLAGHCPGSGCLHLGRKQGDRYLDPLELLVGPGRFRLVPPDGPPPTPPGGGELAVPVGGPVTSPFGMRDHPLTGEHKLHDGIDFGAPCGADVRAAAGGTVTSSGLAGAYGLRVEVDHGGALSTSYSHLSAAEVRPGDRVAAGEPIGAVGSTGSSTGCHLHFSVHRRGTAVDPSPYL